MCGAKLCVIDGKVKLALSKSECSTGSLLAIEQALSGKPATKRFISEKMIPATGEQAEIIQADGRLSFWFIQRG